MIQKCYINIFLLWLIHLDYCLVRCKNTCSLLIYLLICSNIRFKMEKTLYGFIKKTIHRKDVESCCFDHSKARKKTLFFNECLWPFHTLRFWKRKFSEKMWAKFKKLRFFLGNLDLQKDQKHLLKNNVSYVFRCLQESSFEWSKQQFSPSFLSKAN